MLSNGCGRLPSISSVSEQRCMKSELLAMKLFYTQNKQPEDQPFQQSNGRGAVLLYANAYLSKLDCSIKVQF